MFIDVHAHIHPPEFLEAMQRSGRYQIAEEPEQGLVVREQGARILSITPQMSDIEARLADMDHHEVDVQVLSVTAPQVYFLEGDQAIDLARVCNDYLAAVVRQYPDRFRALASIPLTANTIDDAVRELERCSDELGMNGFIIGSNINGVPLDDPGFDPFYEEANRRGSVMFIHPMPPASVGTMADYALAPLVGYVFDTTLAVSRLIFSNFFGRFMGIKVIVAQIGGALPYITGRLDAGFRTYPECQNITRAPLDAIQGLYVDTVASHEPALQCAIDTVGIDRILFGSDYPHVIGGIADEVDLLEEMGLRRRDKRAIYGNNAAALFGLENDDGPHIPLLGMLGG